MWQDFSLPSQDLVRRAGRIAQTFKNVNVSSAHIFLSLLEYTSIHPGLEALIVGIEAKREEARLYVEAMIEPDAEFTMEATPLLDLSARHVWAIALNEARQSGSRLAEPEHLLLACMHPHEGSELPTTLASLGWNLDVARAKYHELRKKVVIPSQNPLEFLTIKSQKTVDRAYAAMRSTWCGRISTAHLLMGLLQDDYVEELLSREGVSARDLKVKIRPTIRSDSKVATFDKRFDKGAKRALDRAKEEAIAAGYKFIGPEHILLGLLPQRATVREILTWGVNVPDVASPELTELDAKRLRQSLGLQPRPNRILEYIGAYANPLIFMCAYFAGTSLMVLLSRFFNPHLVLDQGRLFMSPVVLLGSSLGGVWLLRKLPKEQLRTALWHAFFGFLATATLFASSLLN